jgi:23S rRNA (cytosine1962-C5)-methyltransferase
MDFELLQQTIKNNSQNLNEEFKRIFHGRGDYYEGFSFLTIDSIDNILNIAFYKEIKKEDEEELLNILKKFIETSRHTTINLQRRYLTKSPSELIVGELQENIYAIENKIKFNIDLKSYQNNGYFPDMKNGRSYIQGISKDKNILNLFSYTCGFSLSARIGGASSVFNIDMSKGALSKGRANHHLNNLSTKNIHFGPYNILKSFSRIREKAPYDIIIIDPPTFQKGSFEASKDYIKIIRRLEEISSFNCTILACLNSPFLDEDFLIDLFKEHCPSFYFETRLQNCADFIAIDENKSLKNLIFKNNS